MFGSQNERNICYQFCWFVFYVSIPNQIKFDIFLTPQIAQFQSKNHAKNGTHSRGLGLIYSSLYPYVNGMDQKNFVYHPDVNTLCLHVGNCFSISDH